VRLQRRDLCQRLPAPAGRRQPGARRQVHLTHGR
jgi:hypothetical protein